MRVNFTRVLQKKHGWSIVPTMKNTILIVLMVSLHSGLALSAETDTFTQRDVVLNDSVEALNQQAQEAVRTTLERINKANHNCNEEDLYKELRKHFGNHTNTTFVEDFAKSQGLEVRSIKLDDSVYRDWRPWDGLGMGWSVARKTGLTMSPVVRLGDHLVGTDKLEHMYGQGFLYFKRNYLNDKGATKAIKRGVAYEKTFLGGNKIGNGVFSYGDLSANFNGMRFWNHMLLKREDILGSKMSHGPYIVCKSNKWEQKEIIDFRNYIDDSMDEAFNCSKFPSQKTADMFTARLKKMGMQCPLDPAKVQELKTKYGKMASWIINEEGTGAVSYFNEF